MKKISKRPDLWLAVGIFVPTCILIQLVFLFSFMNELSFYFTIWGAIFLSQFITIVATLCVVQLNKTLRVHRKHWIIGLIAIMVTIVLSAVIYKINTPVLYPSPDTPQVTIASLCDVNAVNDRVSPVCFLSLVPPAMGGIVETFGLNSDPYNIPKTQIISFVFCELLFVFFLVTIYKVRKPVDSQAVHDKD